jgi:hypothetical protein
MNKDADHSVEWPADDRPGEDLSCAPASVVRIPRSWWLWSMTGLVMVSCLAIAGHLFRAGREGRCAWDGLPIEPIYQVRLEERNGSSYMFCCLGCAERWWDRRGQDVRGLWVTDETSGIELAAHEAHFVRSTVVTNAITGNRLHAFREERAARQHAQAARGRVMLGSERPFACDGERP